MKRTFITSAALATCFLLLGQQKVFAQALGPTTLNGAGGGATIAGKSYDFSIGEMTVVDTYNPVGGSLVVTQGVLQPMEQTTGIKNTPIVNNLSVYPNPASTVVNIQYNAQLAGKLSYTLLDMQGKTVLSHSKQVAQGNVTEQVNVANLPAANYMLQVTVGMGDEKQTIPYKIQKLQ